MQTEDFNLLLQIIFSQRFCSGRHVLTASDWKVFNITSRADKRTLKEDAAFVFSLCSFD